MEHQGDYIDIAKIIATWQLCNDDKIGSRLTLLLRYSQSNTFVPSNIIHFYITLHIL